MPRTVTVRIPERLDGRDEGASVILRPPMGRLHEHFAAGELACPCGVCTRLVVHWALVELLQRMRWRIGRPVEVTSGFRCAPHNADVGGAPSSLHVCGMAADVQVDGLTPAMVADVAEECGAGGIGVYPRHTHVDVGPRRRWTGDYS